MSVSGRPLASPQRDAEADQCDAGGHRERAAEGLRQHGQREGGGGAVGEQHGGPASQDARAEQRDAEQQTTQGVTDARDDEQLLHKADAAARAVTHGAVDDVLDVAGVRVRHRREVVADDAFDGEHREVADGQERVPGEPDAAEPAAVVGEHAGEADERQDAHQDLCGLAERHLGGEEVRDVGRRVVDLDADEDGAGSRGAEASHRGEAAGGDVHV